MARSTITVLRQQGHLTTTIAEPVGCDLHAVAPMLTEPVAPPGGAGNQLPLRRDLLADPPHRRRPPALQDPRPWSWPGRIPGRPGDLRVAATDACRCGSASVQAVVARALAEARGSERCRAFPAAAARMHWRLDDPSAASGTDEERLGVFRRVRDEIARRRRGWLADQG